MISKYPGILIYRCRLCGYEDCSVGVPDPARAVMLASLGHPFPPDWGESLGLTKPHQCWDGRWGVADLIGGKEGK